MASPTDETVANLKSATSGFDYIFSNEIVQAKEVFQTRDTPFHALGLGVCAFMEAALGMETNLMAEASKQLTQAEAGAKKQIKLHKGYKHVGRFAPGTEWELVHADIIILLGLTNALNESYMGYLQCLYALNNAHGKFHKLYKTVYPHGVDQYATPATSRAPSPKPSIGSLKSQATSSNISTKSYATSATAAPSAKAPSISSSKSGFFGRWGSTLSIPSRNQSRASSPALTVPAEDGPIEDLIMSGAAFESRYPSGTLWILNRVRTIGILLSASTYPPNMQAKIMRMAGDADGAIKVLQSGLEPGRPSIFVQADALLTFELGWTLLGQRRYQEAADTFIKMTEMNSWSHATYYFIAAGCHWQLKNYAEAQRLMDTIPSLMDRKKIGGKDLPTEVFIKKRLAFYKGKQTRLTGSETDFVQAVRICPAEELAIFWNTHTRISKDIAEAHIREWLALSPPCDVSSSYAPATPAPTDPSQLLDTPDELALRDPPARHRPPH
ncbi:hypothetical protein EWM64_g9534, partial [Hericium alpestre]